MSKDVTKTSEIELTTTRTNDANKDTNAKNTNDVNKDAQKKQPKKWYQKAWAWIKKSAKATYKALTSNPAAIALAVGGIVTGVLTGGIAPLAISATALIVKTAKTLVDAVKARKMRDLHDEYNALIDFATAQSVNQTLLKKLCPELENASELLERENSSSKLNKLEHSHSLETVSKLANVLSASIDIASLIVNPLAAIDAMRHLHHIGTAKNIAKSVSDTLEAARTVPDAVATVDAHKEIGVIVHEHLTNNKQAQHELVELINHDRDSGTLPTYSEVYELQQAARKIRIENEALIAVMQNPSYHEMTDEGERRNALSEAYTKIKGSIPRVEKPKGRLSRMWISIKDALNPFSPYNPNNVTQINKHSELTMAVRRDQQSVGPDEVRVSRFRTQSMDSIKDMTHVDIDTTVVNLLHGSPGRERAQHILDKGHIQPGSLHVTPLNTPEGDQHCPPETTNATSKTKNEGLKAKRSNSVSI